MTEMSEKAYPPVPPIDLRYCKDMDWAYANYADLERAYPNQWVAVVDGQVVAAGTDLGQVKSKAAQVTDRFDIAILFVEHGVHVWFPVLSEF
jgi:hypothetical protein